MKASRVTSCMAPGMSEESELTSSDQVRLRTVCDKPFQESVELFCSPSCLRTLYTSLWIDPYGIDVVERALHKR
jgi:hypothetical protein